MPGWRALGIPHTAIGPGAPVPSIVAAVAWQLRRLRAAPVPA